MSIDEEIMLDIVCAGCGEIVDPQDEVLDDIDYTDDGTFLEVVYYHFDCGVVMLEEEARDEEIMERFKEAEGYGDDDY